MLAIIFLAVKVRAGAEEESREGDEDEGHQHVPAVVQPLDIPVGEDGRIDGPDERAREEDARPDGEDPEHRGRP